MFIARTADPLRDERRANRDKSSLVTEPVDLRHSFSGRTALQTEQETGILLQANWPARNVPCSAPTPWGEWSHQMATAKLTPVGVGIHNVLIATDFSRCSNLALSFGLELAHGYQAEAYVAFVLPTDQF